MSFDRNNNNGGNVNNLIADDVFEQPTGLKESDRLNADPTITALAPWYGANRILAANVGSALQGCQWVGIPFFGGGCELMHIKARTIVASDLHKHVINLAKVVARPDTCHDLAKRLAELPFHDEVLRDAQERCRSRTKPIASAISHDDAVNWAVDYFTCAWMSRSATSGTTGEFKTGLSVRWEAGGGDSVVRFRNATDALAAWHKIMKRCTFVVLDCFDFLAKCKDRDGHAIYCDPPFIEGGEKYAHSFDEAKHRQLASVLNGFEHCRIVCRFYDHDLVRKLYCSTKWKWQIFQGRKQTNGAAPEVLLTKN